MVGFGAGPNFRTTELDAGVFSEARGFQVDFEGGAVTKYDSDWSFSGMARFAYLDNESAPSSFWLMADFGAGYHLSYNHVVSLGVKYDFAFVSHKTPRVRLPWFAMDLGAALSWSYRFGSNQGTHESDIPGSTD
jgi:hypothetical protein